MPAISRASDDRSADAAPRCAARMRATSWSAARFSSSSFSTRAVSSPTGARKSSDRRSSVRSCSRRCASAPWPVSASIRRTPDAMPVSPITLSSPMSPVARAWVPPQSSVENSPNEITRTRSPYFSPNSATAPASIASGYDISRTEALAFASIHWFVRSSIRSISSGDSGASCVKSKRSRSGATSEPFCSACGPSTERSAACKRWVPEWLRTVAARASASTVSVAGSSTFTLPDTTRPRCTTSSPVGRCVSRTSIFPRGVAITPRSPTCPPLSA